MLSLIFQVITDRVRSTTGRLCFDTCLSVCPHGGGGYPSQVQMGGGTPTRSRQGVPSQVQMGVPWPDTDGGTLARSRWGIPWPGPDGGNPRWGTPWQGWGTPTRSGWGYARWGTPSAGMGYPTPPPGTGQELEYLIHHGQYALPLAFTQEDCLGFTNFAIFVSKKRNDKAIVTFFIPISSNATIDYLSFLIKIQILL